MKDTKQLLPKFWSFSKSIWFFPVLATIVLIVLTAFRISGSSVGVYDYLLGGDYESNALVGEPRTVRSDEWVVNTPFVLSQIENNEPLFNKDITNSQDMSLVIDVPYRDWSVLFRPQNLAFFVLPVEYAFAFKWWFLAWLLCISVYLFVLEVLPKKYFVAASLAVFFLLSPFIQWWYQSITILPISYALLIVVSALWLFRAKKTKTTIVSIMALAYLIACFAFVMYPAFQIVAVLCAAALFIAIFLGKYSLGDSFNKITIGKYTLAILLGVLPILIFLLQHNEAIGIVQNTVYPGTRDIASGGFAPSSLIQWPLNYLLLQGGPGSPFGDNQSEASRFLFIGIVFIPLLVFVSLKRNRTGAFVMSKHQRYLLAAVLVMIALFIVRMFISLGDGIFSFLGLNLVPHARLILGLGILNLLLIMLTLGLPYKPYRRAKDLFDIKALLSGVFAFTVILICIIVAIRSYDVTSVGDKEMALVAVVFGAIVGAISHSVVLVRYGGLIVLCITSAIYALAVNPVYQGLGEIQNGKVNRVVRSEEQKNRYFWIANDNPTISSLLVASGAEVFGGVNTYPQLGIWQKYFPLNEDIYNRYAHVRIKVDDAIDTRRIELIQADSFMISTNSCDPMLQSLGIGYIVTTDPAQSFLCFKSYRHIQQNGATVMIHKRQ